ncbi:MAG: 2-phospho-L-lactate transferase [Pseudohongiella sp.]|uniref:2-phospho-L-lactate transferase n=1 Tax=Pseudohongiella sp. TaxID=1979412 RepID=UPI0034A07253
MNQQTCKVLLLAGGVGGAKMAEGFAASSAASGFSILGNIADDQEFHGLWVSPDIDTLTYTLADLIDREKGWGLKQDSYQALAMLRQLGSEVWMNLGDRDLGVHILRTQLRRMGQRPSDIARLIGQQLGVTAPILLPTDDPVHTEVRTPNGWLPFQDYFVRERCQPEVLGLRYQGIDAARPCPEALAAIAEADLIVLAPSNPLVSISPILAVPGIRQAIVTSSALKVAVSPLIAGQTVKGPADKMLRGLGYRADVRGVADMYRDLVDVLLIDPLDQALQAECSASSLRVLTESILMQTADDKRRLAQAILGLGDRFSSSKKPNLEAVF